ncbi:MurR/RpiR family transcriptional regulator [Variovorax paradoxus]|uniref:MurR/RpiR family transcriptional regulator n=1 Tax=Variovorax paradoxus TaxID=34073 RepID=UPI003ECEA4A4
MSANVDIPGTTVAQRIAQALPRLTRSHRKVADYVLEHPLQVATLPIDELAALAGVSIATANRFARALDFDGYATFRAELIRGFELRGAPVECMGGKLECPTNVSEMFAAALDESCRNIEATRQMLDYAACEAAVERLGKARSIYIAGFGASAWLAGLLQHELDSSCRDVRLLPGISGVGHAASSLMHAGSQDVFICLAFPRYPTDAVALSQIARELGCGVVALTDRPTSPVAPLADVVLYCQTKTGYRTHCETSVLAVVEALARAVALRTPDMLRFSSRQQQSMLPWVHSEQGLPQTDAARPITNAVATKADANKRKSSRPTSSRSSSSAKADKRPTGSSFHSP